MSEEFSEKLNKYKIPLILCLVGVVLIGGGAFSSNLLSTGPKSSAKPIQYSDKSVVSAQTTIKVDVSGAVKTPGVYSVPSDARVEDLIKSAEGFHASASAEYINKTLNLSQKLTDGQKIYIPFTGEPFDYAQGGNGVVAGAKTANNSAKIGINSGSQSDLESLPGVGPATAIKIINVRPYQSLDELRTKKAVSKSVFNKIKDLVDLN